MACSGGEPATHTEGLDALLLDQVGAGFALDPGVSGPMSAETASTATPMDPQAMGSVLDRAGLREAYDRIWTMGQDYVTAQVFSFAGAAGARQLADAERSSLTRGEGVLIVDDPAIAGAWVYALYGDTRAKPRGVFCHGEWFALQRYAFSVTTCADHPEGFDTVEQLAHLQQGRALSVSGATAAPTATPTAEPAGVAAPPAASAPAPSGSATSGSAASGSAPSGSAP